MVEDYNPKHKYLHNLGNSIAQCICLYLIIKHSVSVKLCEIKVTISINWPKNIIKINRNVISLNIIPKSRTAKP